MKMDKDDPEGRFVGSGKDLAFVKDDPKGRFVSDGKDMVFLEPVPDSIASDAALTAAAHILVSDPGPGGEPTARARVQAAALLKMSPSELRRLAEPATNAEGDEARDERGRWTSGGGTKRPSVSQAMSAVDQVLEDNGGERSDSDVKMGGAKYSLHLLSVPISHIVGDKHNMASDHIITEKVERMKSLYQTDTRMDPPVAVERGGRYHLADGHHRYLGAKAAGKDEMHVVVLRPKT